MLKRPSSTLGMPNYLVLVAVSILLLLITLPLVAIAIRAAPALAGVLRQPDVWVTVRLTAFTSLIAVVVIVLLGTPMALLLARRQVAAWRIIDTVMDIPVVLPPAVAGIGLLMVFGRRGLLGPLLDSLGIDVAFTTAAVIIAQVFVALPLYVRAAVIGLKTIDPDFESVAMVEGANTWQVFTHITLPLAAPAMLSGATLAWARTLGEFGATILFAGNLVGRTQTMSLAIYIDFQSSLHTALALSFLLVLVSFGALLAVRAMERQ